MLMILAHFEAVGETPGPGEPDMEFPEAPPEQPPEPPEPGGKKFLQKEWIAIAVLCCIVKLYILSM